MRCISPQSILEIIHLEKIYPLLNGLGLLG